MKHYGSIPNQIYHFLALSFKLSSLFEVKRNQPGWSPVLDQIIIILHRKSFQMDQLMRIIEFLFILSFMEPKHEGSDYFSLT